ncbi:hypothetical protein JDS73_32055, partial [Bacillus cereus]|nr:hypothetical protein [Bacillus cereus]
FVSQPADGIAPGGLCRGLADVHKRQTAATGPQGVQGNTGATGPQGGQGPSLTKGADG